MESEIRLAEKREIPALCEIWKTCFRDSDDYIRLFYSENFDHLSAFVYAIGGRPVSMLHTLDSVFANGTGRREAKFLYAGGTLPEYRNRGCYGALFEHVKSLADQKGFALFGKPASRDLIPYYKTLGFEPDACFRSVTVIPGEKLPLTSFPLSPEEYNRMRDRAFCGHPYAKWTDRHVGWCIADNEYFGGRTLAVELDGALHFLMGAPNGSTLEITETDLTLPQLKKAGGALCAMFGTALLKAYLPDYSCKEGEEIVSSIVYNSALDNTYVNLILS